MTYKVSPVDLGALRLNETQTVASVLQNVAVILSTPKGSILLYREFGLSMDFVDKPAPVARAMAYAAVKSAVETAEPRAEVVGIVFRDGQAGELIPIVEVIISE